MEIFVTETQGLDTFQVCAIKEDMQLDTVGLGMLLNNKISGLCPVSTIHIDNKEYIRYNISSQIPLKQFFMEEVDKKRILTILKNILETFESIEEYMLEPGMILLDTEDIYLNVSTLQTNLIYYPIVSEEKNFDLKRFVKSIIVNIEFDSTEQDNYVSLLINFLNKSECLTVSELKEFIINLMDQGNNSKKIENNQPVFENENTNNFAMPQQMEQKPSPIASQSVFDAAPQSNNKPIPKPMMPSQPAMPQKDMKFAPTPMGAPISPSPAPMPPQPGMMMPPVNNAKPEKKKGFFASLFHKDSDKEDKKDNKKAKNNKNVGPTPAGLVIPGADNSKNNAMPQPMNAPKFPAGNGMGNNGMPMNGNMAAPIMPNKPQPMAQPMMPQSPSKPVAPQPVMNKPGMQPAMPQPIMAKPVQPVNSAKPIIQPIMPKPVEKNQASVDSTMQKPFIQMNNITPNVENETSPVAQQVMGGQQQDFGGTVVLGAGAAGETTVLSEGYNTLERQQPAYLIRKRTNEKIDITKEIFKIGKEQSYVDYYVSDNPAVSRSHANIVKKNDEYYIIDNNSLNHTFLDGKQIPSQQMQKLEDFMVIKMADELFEFRL